jgi:hypothetical protein
MVIYKYLFYRFYKWASGLAYDNTPEFTSLFTVSGLQLLNVLTLINLVNLLCYQTPIAMSLTFCIAIAIFVAIVNYLILFRYLGLNNIIKEFSTETKKEEKYRSIYIGLYVLASVICCIKST